MDNKWSLPLRRVPQKPKKDTSIVWNTTCLCYEQKLFGQVTSLQYNTAGTVLGATSTNQLALLRVPQSDGVVVNEQSERRNFSVGFRQDDKLYIQSIDQRVVIRSSETAFERQFMGHTRDVRCAIFVGLHNFVSGSDDTTIKMWDLLSETDLSTGVVHTDYVRCLEPYTSGTFISGSYDHCVNLWDPRAGLAAPMQTSGTVIPHAVESLSYIPDGEKIAVGAGDQVLLFDTRKGLAVPLFASSFNSKSVCALSYSVEHKTLVTGSLDGRVKMLVLDGDELRCLCTKKFDTPITTVAVHPESKEFAVGAATGDIKVFQFDQTKAPEDDVPELDILIPKKPDPKEVVATHMQHVEQQLGTYQYGKALKTALYARHADVLVSTVEELLRRGTLHIALNNQNDRTVVRLLRFATEYVDKPQFTDTMFAVFECICMIYGPSVGRSVFFHKEMMKARKRIGESIAMLQDMEKTLGVMEMIVNAA